jgi:leucyl-tRNA synthetase
VSPPSTPDPATDQATAATSASADATAVTYDPSIIEPKWQRFWKEHKTFRAARRPGRPKMYVLDMFPYPSGAGLHVGHPEGYTATDIVSRYKRMRGFDVLHPMGWDAFGLPAEQHAIRTGTHPRSTTLKNIETFRRQLETLGFSFDWDREVDTTSPGYVRWTQWIFLQLFEKGLAFQQSDMPVNWCPALGTVLANDEITPDGRSEVGGFPVEKLKIRQWSLRITAYADRLLDGLEGLDWPETKAKQTHWIGRSEGANVTFDVVAGPPKAAGASATDRPDAKITVFTTRVDTLPGATYVVLAPEHPLAQAIATPEHAPAVKAYAEEASRKSDVVRADATRAKTGVPTGAFAVNPINGERIPVWVADYVIGSYGTGAVMAVPAHDERDHAFAVKYKLPIVRVVARADGAEVDVAEEAFVDDGVANDEAVRRSEAPIAKGQKSEDVRRAVTGWLASQGKGSAKVTYRLRDWVFSRQRYWGEPIPIYFPVTCDGDPRAPGASYTVHYDQPIPVDATELPLLLPDLEDYKPGTDPAGPLARALDWRFFQKDGKWYARETNTMPQWAGSCWYYLRYLDPKNDKEPWTEEAYDAWMPVDLYVGGSEHAVLHLLYARFWHKVLFDLGLVKHEEPFQKLVHQGLILGEVEHIVFHEAVAVPGSRAKRDPSGSGWIDAETGKPLRDRRMAASDLDARGGALHLREADVPVLTTKEGEHFAFYAPSETLVDASRAKERDDGSFEDAETKRTLVPRRVAEADIKKSGAHWVLADRPDVRVLSQAFKMSKSRGNVVNPDDIIKSHGADSLRLYEMFMGPLEAVKPWQTSGIEGVRRFLERAFRVASNVTDEAPSVETSKLVHKTLKKVGDDIEAMRFNTAISAMMILVNHLNDLPKTPREAARMLVLMLSPFAPHAGEELGQRLGGPEATISEVAWPAFDPALVKDDVVEIGVQVNGKARASVQVPADADEATARQAALADAKVQEFTKDKTVKKVIYVKGRILNFIVG